MSQKRVARRRRLRHGGMESPPQENTMPQGAKVLRGDIDVVNGTPLEPVRRPALFLKLWRRKMPNGEKRLFASFTMVRPSLGGYVVKELIGETEMAPEAAVDKAVAIARRGDVTTVYLNADLSKLPPLLAAEG
jgi:hypothetical protein